MSIAVILVPPEQFAAVTAECLDCCAAAGCATAVDWPIGLANNATGFLVVTRPHHIDQAPAQRPRTRPPGYTNDRVREIIEGDGLAPTGLDPATIAAIRRIRQRLRGDRF